MEKEKTIKSARNVVIGFFVLFTILAILPGCSLSSIAEDSFQGIEKFMTVVSPKQDKVVDFVVEDSNSIDSEGDIILPFETEDFNSMMIKEFSIATLSVKGLEYTLPILNDINYLKDGDLAVYTPFDITKSKQHSKVQIIIKGGSFSNLIKLEQTDFPLSGHLKIQKNETYSKNYLDSRLGNYYERSSYSNLSDNQFALFRSGFCPGLAKDLIYTSASSVYTANGRYTYAEKALREFDIRNVINLSAENNSNETNLDSLYSPNLNVLYAPIEQDFNSSLTKESIKKIFTFISNNDGPYLIQSNSGLLECSQVLALLEFCEGGDYNSVLDDYSYPYYWFYNIDYNNYVNVKIKSWNGSDVIDKRYFDRSSMQAIDNTYNEMVANMFCCDSFYANYCNLTRKAFEYIHSCDIDVNTINNVINKLSIKTQKKLEQEANIKNMVIYE